MGRRLFHLIKLMIVVCATLQIGIASAAPYAAMVMDARNGKVLHARNADTRLHPASLTKMMTLYIAFEAVERGEISLDSYVKISKRAANEPPSRLGLRSGRKIKLRYLIRAAAVKSANDAATAIGEAISGSEAAFSRRMNRTAKALGMKRTTFKNAHGLTESGHLSTARDMTILGRHMIYDYPEYYNLFSRRSADAGIRTVNNTNRRLLANYKGADGIKTGYTRAAGFNLVASAERGRERIIATVFGGRSTATRNARVAELLDMGFSRAPRWARVRKPRKPAYVAPTKRSTAVASATPAPKGVEKVKKTKKAAPKPGSTIRIVTAPKRSKRPQARPVSEPQQVLVVADSGSILQAVEGANQTPAEVTPANLAVLTSSKRPVMRPADIEVAQVAAIEPPKQPELRPNKVEIIEPSAVVEPTTPAAKIAVPSNRSDALEDAVRVAAAAPTTTMTAPKNRVVSTSYKLGDKDWAITVGRYGTRHDAEKVLLTMALAEMQTLEGADRRVNSRATGYEAIFTGLTHEQAELACYRLQVQSYPCIMIAPS